MVEEDEGDQRDRKDQARRDAPAQFVPDGEDGNLVSEALALDEPADQEVRQDGYERKGEEFQHRSIPFLHLVFKRFRNRIQRGGPIRQTNRREKKRPEEDVIVVR